MPNEVVDKSVFCEKSYDRDVDEKNNQHGEFNDCKNYIVKMLFFEFWLWKRENCRMGVARNNPNCKSTDLDGIIEWKYGKF